MTTSVGLAKLLEWKDGWVIICLVVALGLWCADKMRRRKAEKITNRFSDHSKKEEKITAYMLKHGGKPPRKERRRRP